MTATVERLQVFVKENGKIWIGDAMLEYKQIGPSMGDLNKEILLMQTHS